MVGWANEPQPGNPVVELARQMRKSVDTSYSDDQVTLNGKQLRELYVGAGLTDVRIVPQGFASTPFAEVVLPPQILTRMMSAMACGFDKVIGKSTPHALLKSLSWNLIAAGRKAQY